MIDDFGVSDRLQSSVTFHPIKSRQLCNRDGDNTLGVTNTTAMSPLDIFVTPGAAIGCVVGIGLSAGLQWLFPNESMVPAQAVIVVVCSVVGLVLEHRVTDRPPKR